jgi:hypothetical protein
MPLINQASCLKLIILLSISLVGLRAPPALAETGSPDSGAIKRVKKRLTPPQPRASKPKKETSVLPSQPIPYHGAASLIPAVVEPKATTPLDWSPDKTTGEDIPPPPTPPITPMPLPTETIIHPIQNTTATNARQEIILQCDSSVFQEKKAQSHGRFFINLFPSDLIPDHQADFRFFRADPLHKSLIKNTPCQDHMCSTQATGSVYYLYQEIRKKSSLRLTLDRRTGSFLAEYRLDSRLGNRHLYETGTCQVEAKPKPIF